MTNKVYYIPFYTEEPGWHLNYIDTIEIRNKICAMSVEASLSKLINFTTAGIDICKMEVSIYTAHVPEDKLIKIPSRGEMEAFVKGAVSLQIYSTPLKITRVEDIPDTNYSHYNVEINSAWSAMTEVYDVVAYTINREDTEE